MNLKTIREAAAVLDIKESIIRRAVRCGELSVMLLGNRMLVDIDEARDVLSKPDGVMIDAVSEETAVSYTHLDVYKRQLLNALIKSLMR